MQRVQNAGAETAALESVGETICSRRLRRSNTITSANDFESALTCFEQGRSIAEDRVDKDLVENSYLQLSADILENEAILFYEHWQAPKDWLQKLSKNPARRVAVIGNSPEYSQLSSTLYHLWVVLDKTDETIDEQVFSRCSSAVRVHQILCKQQVCGLLSDGKESAESTHTIEESCALIVGTGHGGKNDFNIACIQEWGAAALRAVLVAERIKQKYVMMNVSENGHDYSQNDIADRDAAATEAAAEAKSAATLHKVTISIKMLQSAAKNHAGVAQQTMQALLVFIVGLGSELSIQSLCKLISSILCILNIHKVNATVQISAFQVVLSIFEVERDQLIDMCSDEHAVEISCTALTLRKWQRSWLWKCQS